MRSIKVASLVAGMAFTLTSTAWAAWPDDKPIEVIVGFAPGGGTDLMARKLLPFVQKRLGAGAQFVVVNKPGAAGEIANTYVARARPDGYTLAVVNVPSFVFVPMIKKSPYDAKDFVLISRVVDDPTILITRSASKFDSFKSIVTPLKQDPGSLSFGHNGAGTNGDLALQLLSKTAGVQINPVPYKGTAAQKTDVMGGHLDFGVVSAGEVPELHKGGAGPIRAIVQFTAKRSAALPQVPTAAEAGLNVVMSSERGFAAPKGVANNIVERLDKAIEESLKDPEFLATAASDAPVIAYLAGPQWQKSLDANQKALAQLAAQQPKN